MFKQQSQMELLLKQLKEIEKQQRQTKREMMTLKNQHLIVAGKSKRNELEKQIKVYEAKCKKLEGKADQLEKKLALQKKKYLLKEKKNGLHQINSIDSEMAQRKQLLEAYLQQVGKDRS